MPTAALYRVSDMSDPLENRSGDDASDREHDAHREFSPSDSLVDQYGQPIQGTQNLRERRKNFAGQLIRRFRAEKRLNVWLTAIIAISTVCQTVNSCNNNASTSKQVNQLIDTASRIGSAADSFSRSASRIDTGVSSAVAQLNEQAQKMESARKSSENQSRASLQSSIGISRNDQRAWVAPASPEFNFTDGVAAKVIVHLHDVGKSPAVNIVSLFNLVDLAADQEIGLGDIQYRGIVPINSGTLFPTEDIPIQRFTFAAIPSYAAYREGKRTIYAFGRVSYEDVFSNVHWTEFCYRVDADLKTGQDCKIYNDTDDHSKR